MTEGIEANMTYEDFCNKFHIRLNQQQLDAVRAIEGPVLLLAVPGSGKTTVLVTRLGYMIYCAGIAPEKILTVTYTVSAARDMSARFCSSFGNELKGRMAFRTINGICAKIIQYYGNRIGKSAFSLALENEGINKMLFDIFRRTQEAYATESDLKGIRTLITYIKNRMLTGEEIRELDEETGVKISEIYKAYCKGMHSRHLMDYDDQMLYAYNILRKSSGTLEYFQNKYTYICVDEAQDTSKIQHAIIRLLAGSRDNLFMVGDEDQSIYGFRAAYPEALLSFEKDHPGARVLLMEKNFRSNGEIVAAADRFIQKNILRHEKHMTASREAGAGIEEITLKDRNAQYQYLAKAAEELKMQTAVLYRNNENALPLIDLLERQGTPYRIRNAELVFFTHRVVLDIRNIIYFAANPNDTELFLQIYYKVATYVNKQDAIRICEISRSENREVLEVAGDCEGLPVRTMQRCKSIENHLKAILTERADRAIDRILGDMGYGDYLKRMDISDSKLFILRTIAQQEASPERLIERLDELQAIVKGKQENPGGQGVVLSTIHSSKGLEYDAVYLMDAVDGIFPESVPQNLKNMDKKEQEAYEEERRLFYVGVTRARDRLLVFRLSNQKSAFCRELTYKEKERAEKTKKLPNHKNISANPVSVYTVRKKPFSQTGFREFLNAIGEGLIVRHKKLGEGVVVEIWKDKVVIQFEKEQRLFELKTLYEYDLLVF